MVPHCDATRLHPTVQKWVQILPRFPALCRLHGCNFCSRWNLVSSLTSGSAHSGGHLPIIISYLPLSPTASLLFLFLSLSLFAIVGHHMAMHNADSYPLIGELGLHQLSRDLSETGRIEGNSPTSPIWCGPWAHATRRFVVGGSRPSEANK